MAFDVFAAFPTGTVEFPEPAFQFVDALVLQGITCLSERQYLVFPLDKASIRFIALAKACSKPHLQVFDPFPHFPPGRQVEA